MRLLACEPAAPPVVAEVPAEVPVEVPVESPRGPAIVVDAAMVDHFPSLEHYPDLGMGMSEVLAEGRPREILAKVAESLVAYRWPTMLDWDRNGFIDVQGPRPGFVTRVSGRLISQPMDRHDLGAG